MTTTINNTSQIQAKYALSILRVAKGADQDIARRLVEGIARDLPLSDVRAELADAHFAAIESYRSLADSLRQHHAVHPWKAAFDATNNWLWKTE